MLTEERSTRYVLMLSTNLDFAVDSNSSNLKASKGFPVKNRKIYSSAHIVKTPDDVLY